MLSQLGNVDCASNMKDWAMDGLVHRCCGHPIYLGCGEWVRYMIRFEPPQLSVPKVILCT